MTRKYIRSGRTPQRVAIGTEFQFHRQQRGVSQISLASCVGCCENTIGDVERGLIPATLDLWLSVAECLVMAPLELIPERYRHGERA